MTSDLEAGRPPEAIRTLRAALAAEPDNLAVMDRLSAALAGAGDHAGAEEITRRALALDDNALVWLMRLGMALAAQGKWAEAARAYADVLARDPRIADAHHNMGDALARLGRIPEAVGAFRQALALNPQNPDTHNALGVALQEVHLWEAASARFERALALDSAHAPAEYDLGLARLILRDFERGWTGFERRLQCAPVRARMRKDPAAVDLYERLPRWQGPQEAGVREVAIWAEQGIGDQVLFSTLIPELVAAKARFLYEVDPRLLKAHERAFPGVTFVPSEDPPRRDLQQADRALLAGSLPVLFRTSRASFSAQPSRVLVASPERAARYREQLAGAGPGLKVALAWKSTRGDWWAGRKNAALADLAPLLATPGVTFLDVQYGDTGEERRACEAAHGARLIRFEEVDYFNDLEEVLAILEACDLVVTTSNATAHFAGALGKRTWLLYLADRPPFHYWSHGGTFRSLWYPSVEIVTGKALADWPALAGEAARRLRAEAGVAAAPGPTDPVMEAVGRARTMRTEGRLQEAVELLRGAAAATPRAELYAELAHALRWMDRLDDARAAAERAIALSPECAPAWFQLGAVQLEKGETGQGIASYRKAVEIQPDFAEAWSNLGGTLGERGDKTGELEAYLHAVYAKPGLAPAWSNLGSAFMEAGELAEAESACLRCLEAEPAFAAGWNNLANVLQRADRLEEAAAAGEKAVALAPAAAEAWSTLGAVLHGLARYDEAIAAHRRALAASPGDPQLNFNLGLTLMHRGDGAEAIASFRRALQIAPGHVQAHWNLGFVLLGMGRLAEGWEEFEWRWRRDNADAKRYDFAPWQGELTTPRRLLLWAEQGVGDQILFSSMLPDLASSVLHVTLEVDPRLAPLYRRSFPRIDVIAQQTPPAQDPAAYDCQAPLGSLGRWLRSSFETFPRHAGYLAADAARAAAYRERLLANAPPGALLVGISWKSANREFGAFKSTTLRDWFDLLRVAGARFVDLQYGDTAAERAAIEREGVTVAHLPDLDLYGDLEGVAALCAACDLVITVSNVTAHMAGALGRPVWLIVPKGNGRLWYWFAGRADSPWYPSMRIFTRQAPGGWPAALQSIARELVRGKR